MAFRTKLDYSNNRQILQREQTFTTLSGSSTFGVPFSALTSGPDLNTTIVTEDLSGLSGTTFSGNNTTTIFNFADSRMNLGANAFSAITPTTFDITQDSGDLFTPLNTTTLDGNVINLSYTGVNFTLDVETFVDLGGSTYSGTIEHSEFFILSANTLDFTERTIWIDNPEITRTDRLIISRGAQPGYIFASDGEGMGTWIPSPSGFSATTVWENGSSGISSIRSKTPSADATGDYALASGSGTTASGNLSYAQGQDTTANASASHAEGRGTIASGPASHSEGRDTTASGFASHAEGRDTIASGLYSHAEGNGSMALGNNSHAEGLNTEASGTTSHAQGQNTTASGDISHAEGNGSMATGLGSHAEGSVSVASGPYSHAEGKNSTASGEGSHAQGVNTTASGDYSHAEGDTTIASANMSHAEGQLTTASGLFGHSEGRLTIASGYASHAEGELSVASGNTSHAEGNNTLALGPFSHSEGQNTQALGSRSHAEGRDTIASGNTSHAEGRSTTASGDYSHSEGNNTIASNFASHAEGQLTIASGLMSHAEGMNTIASGQASHVEGKNNTASGYAAHAEGEGTTASGYASHAQNFRSTASGDDAHAEGHGTIASAHASHAEGVKTQSIGEYSHAQNASTIASGLYSHAGGKGFDLDLVISATPVNTIVASGATSFVHYTQLTSSGFIGAYGDYSAILGGTNHHINSGAHRSIILGGGNNTIDTGIVRSAIIGGNTITATQNDTVYVPNLNINDIASNATDYDVLTIDGSGNVFKHTFPSGGGGGTSVWTSGSTGNFSIKADNDTTTDATGDYAVAENQDTLASGEASHAEGTGTLASGDHSHAEGHTTIASGFAAHAEGHATQSLGHASHSEGEIVVASGDYSHAGGFCVGGANLIVASGTTSFVHYHYPTANGQIGAYGNFSAILGGTSHNINTGASSSAILGGANNIVDTNTLRSVVLGGSAITATTNDTVYVPDLVIDGLTSVTDLQTDANGLIIDGASDISLKENITELDSALNKVNKLRGVSFDWKPEANMGGGKYFGLIAQEVKEVIPEIVKPRVKNEKHLTLDYKALIPWLVEAVKELSTPSSPIFNEIQIQTETIASEDSDILLNFNGNHESALNGGLVISKGVNEETNSQFIINGEGDWQTNTYIIPHGIIIPEFTPESSFDDNGKVGEITRDDDYIYIKGNDGQWKRTKLETF